MASVVPESRPLSGRLVTIRPATLADVPELVAIRATPEVRARWRGDDLVAEVTEDLTDPDMEFLVVELEGRIAGGIQWHAEDTPDYRHAGIDIFLAPWSYGRGVGTDAVRTLAIALVDDLKFHRLVIDPAADNEAAIRCYAAVGFRPVGVMRRYERDVDGTGWHDGLLMDLLAAELIRE